MAAPSSVNVRRPRVTHLLVILAGLTVVTAALGLIVPPGGYERDAAGRVVTGTFAYDHEELAGERPRPPRGAGLLFAAVRAPLAGIADAAGLVAFLLVAGGALKVVETTQAYDTALRTAVRYLGSAEYAVIPATMALFSLVGATTGLGVEIVPFVLLSVPIVHLFGYHPLIGVAVPLIGAQAGAAVAGPSLMAAAREAAAAPPGSPWGLRAVLWLAVTALSVVFVTLQARRAGYATETLDADMAIAAHAKVALSGRQILVLLVLAAGLGAMAWGVGASGWTAVESGGVLLAMGVAAGFAGALSARRIASSFAAGARDLAAAALAVGAAQGVAVLAREARIVDTVVHFAAGAVAELSGVLAASLMFLFHGLLNLFVPSGPGQAALALPVMVPLAEAAGLTRQTAVLAFQLGDGFSNLLVPTSAVLVASLEAVKVPYGSWLVFVWKLLVVLVVFGLAALALAHAVGFGP